MKSFTITASLLGLLSSAVRPAWASSLTPTETSSFSRPLASFPAKFTPPQVFKNANLVHIISLEKNYVKENINVVVENVAPGPQDEYFLPFSSELMERVGGFEVKDRKDANVGPFEVAIVEYDAKNPTQYYRVKLPKPLAAGAQQTLGISFNILKAYAPLPSSIAQDEQQYLSHTFSAYCSMAYPTEKQKTEVKFPTTTIPDFTKVGETQKTGSKITYGPYDARPAGASEMATVRFEFTKPVLHVEHLRRDIEVSHWGGNVAFEEGYELVHRGANLSQQFNRVKWQQSQYYKPASHALKEMKFPLRVGSADAYYTDVIGNVSTSRFRSNKKEALLETKPRYPVFGGWKYPFVIGWNSDAKNFLRKTKEGGYVLNVPFLEGPKQAEGVEYGTITVQVLLPEGAENVKYFTNIPEASIDEATVNLKKTYLDTTGRTAVTVTASNLVDDFRDRELIIVYDYSLAAALHKPVVVFVSTLVLFVAGWVVGGLEFRIARKQ